MKKCYSLLLFMILVSCLWGQVLRPISTGIIAESLFPYRDFLIVPYEDSSLGIYQVVTTPDSILVTTYSCHPNGEVSDTSVLYKYFLTAVVSYSPIVLEVRAIDTKIFVHVLLNPSTLLVAVIDRYGNATEHVINLEAKFDIASNVRSHANVQNEIQQLEANDTSASISFTDSFHQYDANTMLIANDSRGELQKIDLNTQSTTSIWCEGGIVPFTILPIDNTHCLVFRHLMDDVPVPALYVDEYFHVTELTNSFSYILGDVNKVGDYYLALAYTNDNSVSGPRIFKIQGDSLAISSLGVYHDPVISLGGNRFLSIARTSSNYGFSHPSLFTGTITDGVISIDTGFPQFDPSIRPMNLYRLKENLLLLLLSDSVQVLINTENQELFYSYLTFRSYPKIITAGNYLYFFWFNSPIMATYYIDLALENSGTNNKPESYSVISCYPNPFANEMKIAIQTTRSMNASINIYNIKGRKIRTLLRNELIQNKQTLLWDGKDDQHRPAATGVYFIKMQSEGQTSVRKVVLLN